MSEKITSLTPEQLEQIEVYKQRGIKQLFTTQHDFDMGDLAIDVNLFRKEILDYSTDCPIVVVDNPLVAYEVANLAINAKEYRPEFVEQAKVIVEKNNFKKTSEFVEPHTMGNYNANIFQFYGYILEVLKVEVDADIVRKFNLWKATEKYHYLYFLEECTVCSYHPLGIHVNANYELHREGGPALEYAGNVKVWALNNVRVPQYLAETPSGNLDLEFFKNEKNADVKTEFVRKYGAERMINLGKCIQTYEQVDSGDVNYEWFNRCKYELWDMAVLYPTIQYAPHLKMLNQTTGVWHFEAVSPACRTISDAFHERVQKNNVVIKNIK